MKIFAMAVVLLMSGFVSAQAQTKPCGCEDKKDMLNYLNIGSAALQEYQLYMQRFSTTPEPYSDELLTTVLEAAKNAEKAVRLPGAGSSSLWLDPQDCTLNEPGPSSECLREISKHYLEALQAICQATKGPRAVNKRDYFEGMEMKFLLSRLIAAHQSTEKFILKMLNSLPASCRPNDWFGYVVLHRVGTAITVITTPPRPIINGRGLNGGTSETGQKWTYIGKVLVEDGKAKSIRASAGFSENSASTSSEQELCDGSKTRSHTITFKTSADGEAEGNVVAASKLTLLTVNPANQTYDLHARIFPRVNTTGQKVFWSKSTGGCRKDQETNRTETFTSSSSESGHSINNEKIKPGSSDYLEGSRVVRPADVNTQGNTSMTITQELHLRWMLRRLPSK